MRLALALMALAMLLGSSEISALAADGAIASSAADEDSGVTAAAGWMWPR